jgi:arginine N-succinyltransferase
MVVIRPVRSSDLGALFELAQLAGVGLTTLPKDEKLLGQRIAKSEASLKRFPDRPGGETYMFVMEDLENQQVVGTCAIVSKVGGFEPFYAYNIETKLFESKVINVSKVVPILRLVEEHDGPCEIGSLFLHPDYRKHGNGRLLQLVRFLFIAEHAQSFESTVVSEIRGVVDKAGMSPFWDALGRHFFDIDFAEADRLSVVNKRFIADLMPKHPIYIPLLPSSAQEVIGRPHPDSARAVVNLEAEGFKFNNQVDIFVAGPVMSCARDEIRTVKQSRRGVIGEIVRDEPKSSTHMMGTANEDFRACKGIVDARDPNALKISAECAAALQVKVGDSIRYVELDAAA